MHRSVIVTMAALGSLCCGFGRPLAGQQPDSAAVQQPDSAAPSEQPPVFGFGVSGGAASFRNGSTSQAMTATLQYSPLSWLSLSVSPAFAKATDSTGRFSTSGVTDLPVAAGAWHTFHGGWYPTLGFSLGVTLPIGDTATGFGNGKATMGASLGLSASPVPTVHLSVGAGRGFTGASSGSTFAAGTTTSFIAEASTDVGERATVGLSYGEDFGSTASEPLAKVFGGGVSYALAGPLAVTLDASHGFGVASAKWLVSLGVGTAFAGISPVNPTTPLKRLRALFGGNGVGSSKGGKAKNAPSCRARKC